MKPSDLDEVMAIERLSFSSPWSSQFFLEELKAPYAMSLLAEVGERSVGYIIYWVLARELDVHNLAVYPAYRRRGIGRALLCAAIDKAISHDLSRVTLEVRKSNAAAQHLYRSLGFVAQGVRRGYYSDDGEDALLMALEIEN
jgi:ribosomal-protein-alanine N-acetyltransferase